MTVPDGFQLQMFPPPALYVASEPGGMCAPWAWLVWRGDYAQSKEVSRSRTGLGMATV